MASIQGVEHTIAIQPDGSVRFVYSDELAGLLDLGPADVRRASHVEPEGDSWTADLSPVGGPKLGPFRLRKHALAAEVAWIEEHILCGH